MGADLGTTNTWLAILTIAVIIQTIGLIVAAVIIARVARRVDGALERAEATIAPLSLKAHKALDELHALSTAARQAEQTIRETTEQVGQRVRDVRTFVAGRFWPVIGLARGLRAVASTLRNRPASPRARALDEIGESRFVYEGGGNGGEHS